LDAVSALGVDVDGRLHALSSYENRVYELCCNEGQESVIAKFYRPKRWSRAQILEEHAFALALEREEVPMVAPMTVQGQTLHEVRVATAQQDEDGPHVHLDEHEQAESNTSEVFFMSLSPKRGGRWPELDDPEVLTWLGRLLARVHQVSERQAFVSRPSLDMASFGWEPRQWLLEDFSLPAECREEWAQVSQAALALVQEAMSRGGATASAASSPSGGPGFKTLRLHGDFHPGNILWTPAGEKTAGGPHFVDLDDARMGPAVQDLWMLLNGERADQTFQLSCLLEGYETLRDFDRRELALIEPLRTLRLIHYSAWLAQRMGDPAFVRAFDWFGTTSYWRDQIVVLQDQCERMRVPPLVA
jgi:Ser/Thr protein kinase RdoA (MazF antagonist)